MLYSLSIHTWIASNTGALVYSDDTSKLIIISSSSRITFFSLSHIVLVEELILHYGTTDNHSSTRTATLWYEDPGIDSTSLTGMSFLCTFTHASPYRRAG